jgi:hypothetical protein
MISKLKPENVRVLSLTTIATPHRGSAFADYAFNLIGGMYMFWMSIVPHLNRTRRATSTAVQSTGALRGGYGSVQSTYSSIYEGGI